VGPTSNSITAGIRFIVAREIIHRHPIAFPSREDDYVRTTFIRYPAQPLMSKDLTESPGREALMITVEHAPGGSSAIHRHNAHAFVYVLEGSVVMQLKGGQQVTLTPGQSFYEGPRRCSCH